MACALQHAGDPQVGAFVDPEHPCWRLLLAPFVGSFHGQFPCNIYLLAACPVCAGREDVYDLLRPGSGPLNIREDIRKGVYVEGLCERVVDSGESAGRACRLYSCTSTRGVCQSAAAALAAAGFQQC